MKLLLQKLLQFKRGTHKQPYWICSDKSYCALCKYASEICMYGEEESDYEDTIPCVNALIRYRKANQI